LRQKRVSHEKHEYNSHHVFPSSRYEDDNQVLLPKKFHTAWHTLFGNMTGREIIHFIERLNILMSLKDKITAGELEQLRQEIKAMKIYYWKEKR
jgi:hypothetical protein